MKKQRFVGLLLLVFLPSLCLAEDKSKKAYELIYEDVQVLKKQLMALEARLDKNAVEIQYLKEQIRGLQNQIKAVQSDQASLQEGIKNIPTQYQFLLDRLDQMNLVLAKISEGLLMMKGTLPQVPEAKEDQKPPGEKKPPEQKKEAQPSEPKPVPRTTSLSPQEVYNTAYADYLKGNFDLAVDGFKIYHESFPDSPLTDNALYWIGECYYSQRNFEEAIEQFNDLILNYPQGDKIAAAYLKKGLALTELGRKEEALTVFRLLIGKYPLEEEARIAQEKIKELIAK